MLQAAAMIKAHLPANERMSTRPVVGFRITDTGRQALSELRPSDAGEPKRGRSQTPSATPSGNCALWSRQSWRKASAGVFQSSVLRGRVLSSQAIASSWRWL